MPKSAIHNVRLVGVASCVPGPPVGIESNAEFTAEEVRKIAASSGIERRHLADPSVCTSDLCMEAAQVLLADLGWEPGSIDALLFVSQTPDYVLPATACSLHGRLGLPASCAAFDINLGCSGYVYGLWVAANLVSTGNVRRLLLLAGDTVSRIVSPRDRSVSTLFGDAGTATAIEFEPRASVMHFELGSDGAGQEHLIVPAGGFRKPASPQTQERTGREGGNIRGDQDLFMNGGEIFAFTMQRVPELCRSLLASAAWPPESVDAFVMHQANRFLLQHLGKQMRIPKDKLILAMENYGNTSSASIPLAITDKLAGRLTGRPLRLVLAGFGVGFSWAAVAFECGLMRVPAVVILDPAPVLAEAG